MSDQSTLGLGKLYKADAPTIRDAIHIAVVPVIAEETLQPGAKVRVTGYRAGEKQLVKNANGRPYIGVVDPYLQVAVARGECCWLYLNPGSIRGLRHEWAHPAFDKEQA